MKTKAINDMLSAIVMLAMDVTTAQQVVSAKAEVDKFAERVKNSLGEDVSTHFQILAYKILNTKTQ